MIAKAGSDLLPAMSPQRQRRVAEYRQRVLADLESGAPLDRERRWEISGVFERAARERRQLGKYRWALGQIRAGSTAVHQFVADELRTFWGLS